LAREYIDENPDPVAQFNDLVAGFGTRDRGGLPLGNVYAHALNRYDICHAILEAAQLGSQHAQLIPGVDGIPPKFEFMIGGAVPQDRRGTREYPAAHLAPGTVKLGDPASVANPVGLYDIFSDGVTKGYVYALFGRTELVHRLTNYCDSVCERKKSGDGLAQALVDSCEIVARDPRAKPIEVLHDKLIPDFKNVAGRQLAVMETTLSATPPEQLETSSPIVDQYGLPYRNGERPADTRIHSPSPDAWRANRQAVIQILGTYAGANEPDIRTIRERLDHFKALRFNEEREARGRRRRP
jgi:hypothetical protein